MHKAIAALAATLVGGALLHSVPSHADEPAPTRVLIVGDSVTHGLRGDYTWRYFAWQSLQQAGAAVDFVGPHTGTNGIEPELFFSGAYADPGFDADHAARWGMAMREMLDKPDAYSPAIGDLVAAHAPDVIVEQLGVNDFDREGLTAGDMVAQVRRFVADARAVKSDVDVVLGSLPQTWIREVGAYNAALPGLAAELSSAASRVVSTPVAPFVNGVDTYDFAHPTTAGQEKLAAAVTAGLADLGVGAAPDVDSDATPGNSVTPPLTAPLAPAAADPGLGVAAPLTPPLSIPRLAKAVRHGVRVVVSWRSAADQFGVRCGQSRRVTGATRVTFRSVASRCKVRSVGEAGRSPWVVVRVR